MRYNSYFKPGTNNNPLGFIIVNIHVRVLVRTVCTLLFYYLRSWDPRALIHARPNKKLTYNLYNKRPMGVNIFGAMRNNEQ